MAKLKIDAEPKRENSTRPRSVAFTTRFGTGTTHPKRNNNNNSSNNNNSNSNSNDNLSGMDDDGDVDVVGRGELAEGGHDLVLLPETVHRRVRRAHHELQVVDDDVADVVHVDGVRTRLRRHKRRKKKEKVVKAQKKNKTTRRRLHRGRL